MPLDPADAAAGGAWVGNDLAAAMTLRTGLLDGEKALRHAHLALTVAGGAGLGLRSRLGARAVAGRALLQRGDADLGFGAARRLFQRKLEVVAQIGAAIHAIAATPCAARARAAENLAEDVAERIGEPAEAFRSAETPRTGGAKPGGSVDARMTELIVCCALLGVGENLVRGFRFLEFFLGSLVVRIAVRMMLHRELPIRLLDVLVGRVAIDAEYRVEIALSHRV